MVKEEAKMVRGVLRRVNAAMDAATTQEVLQKGDVGYLGTVNGEGEPYVVPLDYVAEGDKIYFHCASAGYKLDNIRANPRVCFTVTGDYRAVPEKTTTVYRSVVVFGRAKIVDDFEQKRQAVQRMMAKYAPGQDCSLTEDSPLNERMRVVEITVEQMTGKQNQV